MITLALLIIAGALFYFRVSLLVWSAVILVELLLWSKWGSASVATLCVIWTLFLVAGVILNFRGIRRKLITRHILPIYQRIMPRMSDTEKQAIAAGTVGFEAEIFQGNLNWSKYLDMPLAKLTAEEQAFIDNEVKQLCEMTDDWQITHDLQDLPPQIWQFVKEKGFWGLIIPKNYGGKGFSALAHSEILMRLYSRSTTLASTVAVPNSLGPGELLLHYGTEEQKNYYLPRLARGEEIPCFALTAPEAGSDAGAITDYGIVCHGEYEGKEVLGIKLNWNKRYITLAPIATVLGLAFKLYDPEKLLSDQVDRGITCALIPPHLPGVTIGRRHFPLNVPFQNGPTQGKEVFVPLDFIIGGAPMIGHGWRMLMECLSAGRAITLPSSAVGQVKMFAHVSGAYGRIRRQFNLSICQFEGIEEPLARIGAAAYYLNGARMVALSAVDRGEKPSIVSAIMKYHATEVGRQAACDAMDIHGGKGICLGPDNYLGRFYQGAPIAITVEGANILTRNMIIFGQGAIRCHPYAFKELQAAQIADPKQALKEFDKALFSHMGYTLSNAVRSFWLSLSDAGLVFVPSHGHARRYLQQITRLSANFAFLADVAMLSVGAELKRKESLSARLADIMSYLYLAAGAVKYFIETSQPEEDLPLLDYSCQHLLFMAQTRFDELLRSFPIRPLGWLLRILIMPKLWPTYHEADDYLRHKISQLLSLPSQARARLIEGIDQCEAPQNPIHLLQITLAAVLKNEPVEKRFRQAIREGQVTGFTLEEQWDDAVKKGILTAMEAQECQETHALRMRVINVDNFDKNFTSAAQ
ncbi:MAG: fadE 2 [Gammaproteobacteria bacterium]|jgi:acyl-CoA dehydrogenase|nr:fadE 2 [Gammaproteobacteria bacterium]